MNTYPRTRSRGSRTRMGRTTTVVDRPAFSPAQLVAVAAGLLLTIIGAIGLARTGTNLANFPTTYRMVAGFGFSSLSALVEVIAGVILLGAGVFPETARAGLAVFGVLLIGWGIVIVADAARLLAVWGYTQATGVLYIVIGAMSLLSAVLFPIFYSTHRETTGMSDDYANGVTTGPDEYSRSSRYGPL